MLYRLGRSAAAHAGRVALAWALMLALAVGLMATLGVHLSTSITLEGTPSQQVVDELKSNFPVGARGTGQIVFQSTDATALTDAQRRAISAALVEVKTLPGVADVVDPFTVQASLDEGRANAADGSAKLDDGAAKLDQAQAKLDDGRVQLTKALADLDAAQAKLDAGAATLAEKSAELKAGQAKLDTGKAALTKAARDLDAGQAKIDAGRTQLAPQQAALTAGQAKLDAAAKELAAKASMLDAAIAQALTAGAPTDQLLAQQAQVSTAQQALAKQQAELDAGKAKLAAALKDLDAGQAKLDAGRATLAKKSAELKAGQAKLDTGKAALTKAARDLDAGQAKIDAGRTTITEKSAELESGQAKIDSGRADLATGRTDLAVGQRLVAASAGFRTVSTDGTTAIGTVQFDRPINEVSTADREAVVAAVEQAEIPGVRIEVSKDLTQNMDRVLGIGELIGLAVAAIVLFIMLGTLVGAGLPVLSAVLGVGISAPLAMSLSSFVDMMSTTPVLGVMLGLAVGIDYSLFILNRHRRQLKAGVDLHESIGIANGTSGGAVLFAGMTVIIALLALNLTGIGFLALMGTVGAFAIVVAVIAALTFTPAMLRFAGMRVLTRKERAALATDEDHAAAAEPRHAHAPVLPTRHPWLSILVTSVVVLAIAAPVVGIRLGLPDGSAESAESTQYRAYKITSDKFGAGVNGSIATVVRFPQAISEDDELTIKADVADKLMGLDHVAAVLPSAVSEDRTALLLQVIPTEGPSSVETEQLVHDIRGLEGAFAEEFDATLGVTGVAAANIDISQILRDALPIYLGTVLLLSVLLLIAVFRSIAVPILASLGFLATIAATFGAVVAVFQNGFLGSLFGVHDPGPILSFLPIMLIGILFGLAMDYQLFVTSGIREAHIHGMDSKESIKYGLHLSRGVVVAAAIIMVFVFGSFTFSELAMVRPVGFGLAVGVLIDAFLVRLILVPSVLAILGERAWWIPRWLDRILPDLDIEGSALEREHLH